MQDKTMTTVSIQEAATNLSNLIHNLKRGDVVIITENNRPVANLLAPPAEKPIAVPGRCNGMLTILCEDDEHLSDFKDYTW